MLRVGSKFKTWLYNTNKLKKQAISLLLMFKYIQLAKVLREVVERGQQLKSILYNSNRIAPNRIPMAYSLLSLALNNLPALQEAQKAIAEKQGLSINNPYLMCVIIAEYVNTGSIQGGGKLKKAILFCKDLIPHIQKSSKINKQIVQVRIRANAKNFEVAKQKLSSLGRVDRIIPNMYHLSQRAYSDLTKNQQFNLLNSSACVMQSFSSALPPFLLLKGVKQKWLGKQFDVIDACSAPGNKTIELAEYISKGMVFAFQKSHQRFQLLQNTIEKYEVDNIEAKREDFLQVKRKDYKNVKFILLDPSCSGSGMLTNFLRDSSLGDKDTKEDFQSFCQNRYSQLDEKQQQRVQKLHKFQLELLFHAAKFMPQRISYSTCSIYRRQNEDVVNEFLKTHPHYCLKTFRSKSQLIKEGFGELTRSCIRIDPRSMKSDGFFVAILVRRKSQ